MMKTPVLCLLVIVGLAVAGVLSGGEPSPSLSTSPDPITALTSSATAALSKSAAFTEQVSKDRDASQKFLAQTRQLTMTMLNEEQVLLKRREEQADRYEKILATWEKQQAQYQKYLDSLPTK